MGRNRRKTGAGAVERVVYDIFGNVIGQEEEPERAAPTDTERLVRDTTFFDVNNLSAPVQDLIKRSYDEIDRWYSSGSGAFVGELDRRRWQRAADEMRKCGLDPDNQDDRHVYADLVSVFPRYSEWNPSKSERQELARTSKARTFNAYIPPSGPVGYQVGATRFVELNPNPNADIGIEITNGAFMTSDTTPPGVGYAMVARQIAAARIVSDRIGRSVLIRVNAVNSKQLNGYYTWPKMGYVFPITSELRERLRQRGFTDEQTENSATLMMSTSAKGESGFDAWPKVVGSKSSGNGMTIITPKSARSTNPEDFGLAEQVLRAYGKRKGFVKRAMQSMKNDTFLTAEDNDILRDVWRSMANPSN